MQGPPTLLLLAAGLAGCGTTVVVQEQPLSAVRHAKSRPVQTIAGARLRPHAVEPTAGAQAPTAGAPAPTAGAPAPTAGAPAPTGGAQALTGGAPANALTQSDPIGDPNAHAPPLATIRKELRLELVAVHRTNATYIDPLRYVSVWERTDMGVDAAMPVGAPILAPSAVKILGIEPDWYAGQPLVYFELLVGPDAGKIQYVAEQIANIPRPGSILQQGQPIARYAPFGTGIEYGWSTSDGVTLAVATTGYEEGQMTPAGMSIRAWLNSLGAHAGPDHK